MSRAARRAYESSLRDPKDTARKYLNCLAVFLEHPSAMLTAAENAALRV
jgi:hypothetical protein